MNLLLIHVLLVLVWNSTSDETDVCGNIKGAIVSLECNHAFGEEFWVFDTNKTLPQKKVAFSGMAAETGSFVTSMLVEAKVSDETVSFEYQAETYKTCKITLGNTTVFLGKKHGTNENKFYKVEVGADNAVLKVVDCKIKFGLQTLYKTIRSIQGTKKINYKIWWLLVVLSSLGTLLVSISFWNVKK